MKVCRVIKLFTDTISSEYMDFAFQIAHETQDADIVQIFDGTQTFNLSVNYIKYLSFVSKKYSELYNKEYELDGYGIYKFLIVNYRKKLVIDLVVYGQLMILIIMFSFLIKV